jgi:amino acid adenylation domain-containing protein
LSISRKDIIEFLVRAKNAGIYVFEEDGKLKYSLQKNTVPDPSILTELKNVKEEIIRFLKSEEGDYNSVSSKEIIKPRQRMVGEHLPLSFAQERLWFIDQMEGSTQYHIPSVIRLKGNINISALERSLKQVIERHEVLRTLIRQENGQGYQEIKGAEEWKLGILILNETESEVVDKLIHNLINKPFDLSLDFKLRADLIQLSGGENILVATFHHIASDGWSSSVMIKEVVDLYESFISGKKSALEPLEIQYADYAIWQRNYLQGELLSKKLDYWVNKLNNVSPLELPTDKLRPAVISNKGSSFSFIIDRNVSDKLENLNKEKNVTMFMTLLSAFKVLLHRYSGQNDICIGTPIAGRQHHEIEKLIGFFVNTLAIRSDVKDEDSFSELLSQVKNSTLEAYGHQEVPFEKIVEAIVRERDLSRSPIFQVMFAYQNTAEVPKMQMGELELEAIELHADSAKFELAFYLHQWPDNIYVTVEYSTNLFNESSVLRLRDHYLTLLNSIVSNPDCLIGDLEMLEKPELSQILEKFNPIPLSINRELSIVDLFEKQVNLTPNAIALVMDKESMSYSELNMEANKIAHFLRSKGVNSKTLVPIFIDRSPMMIAGVIGILKSGAAYVPIDSGYPHQRIVQILDDLKSEVILSSSSGKSKLSGRPEHIIELDTDWAKISKESEVNPVIISNTKDLAYVLYTSGSTGVPKGVEMSIGSLVNLLQWQNKQFENKQRRVLQYASLNFDVSFQEIFSTLCYGSTLYLIDSDRRMDLKEIFEDIKRYKLTHMFIPFALLKNLAEYILPIWDSSLALEEIIVAGEQLRLTDEINELIKKSNIRLLNHYGPTEAHVVTSYRVDAENDSQRLPPIGKPVDNTRIYIVGSNSKLMPIGVPGEIWIGGVQVAKGYLNRKQLTDEKFTNDPFSLEPKARVYHTGDLGRWLEDGNIEYLGRIDDQVKIRGYRIELGEVEVSIQQSAMVNQCVVIAREDTQGIKRLISYIVLKKGYTPGDIQNHLKEKLPEYMVPQIWVELEDLPLNANGKIDKKSLPDPDIESQLLNQYVAPQNPMQQTLAEIWQELLGIKQVGIHNNFFELGGHSLLAMRVISSIRKQLDTELGVKELFTHPTIAQLSEYLETIADKNLLPP